MSGYLTDAQILYASIDDLLKIKAKVINYENTNSPDELKNYGIGGPDLELSEKDKKKIHVQHNELRDFNQEKPQEKLKGSLMENVYDNAVYALSSIPKNATQEELEDFLEKKKAGIDFFTKPNPKGGELTGLEPPISFDELGRVLYTEPKNINPNRQKYALKDEKQDRNIIQKVFDKISDYTKGRKEQDFRDSIQKSNETIKDMAKKYPKERFNTNERQPMPPMGEWPNPVKDMKITSPYGNRKHPIYERPIHHDGIDIGVPMNTPVYASFDGEITKASDGKDGYGKEIVINHGKDENGKNVETRHAHLNDFKVKKGDIVKSGQEIGRSGSTGASTGPHLHYGIRFIGDENRKNRKKKGDVDPLKYLKK